MYSFIFQTKVNEFPKKEKKIYTTVHKKMFKYLKIKNADIH